MLIYTQSSSVIIQDKSGRWGSLAFVNYIENCIKRKVHSLLGGISSTEGCKGELIYSQLLEIYLFFNKEILLGGFLKMHHNLNVYRR